MGNQKLYPNSIQNMKTVDLEKQRLILKMVYKTVINVSFKDKVKEKMSLFFNHHQYAKNHLNVKLSYNKELIEHNIL